MIERIDGDVTALSNFFSQFSVRLIGAGLMLVGILTLLWLETPLAGLMLSVFTVLVMVGAYQNARSRRAFNET